jgi:hypothetical protein
LEGIETKEEKKKKEVAREREIEVTREREIEMMIVTMRDIKEGEINPWPATVPIKIAIDRLGLLLQFVVEVGSGLGLGSG